MSKLDAALIKAIQNPDVESSAVSFLSDLGRLLTESPNDAAQVGRQLLISADDIATAFVRNTKIDSNKAVSGINRVPDQAIAAPDPTKLGVDVHGDNAGGAVLQGNTVVSPGVQGPAASTATGQPVGAPSQHPPAASSTPSTAPKKI
jgi:hypothetical protein